ncbi:hypothetical protein [Porphyrobacter sp. AAP60]|uniref:hypothetical protein n=1 Tax=Porphyrobacter sp. AAP60 TaxID=1523423 RepID=UPI000A9CA6FB|nr:hypothetical protein [Porphyrobacter sp. AAP60]
MARLRRSRPSKKTAQSPADSGAQGAQSGKGIAGLPLPSPSAATNLVIADIVMRAASGLLRKRMEKGMLIKSYDSARAEKLVDGRGVAATVALWGASRLATRSPIGLAVIAGGLAAKVLYDRGKQIQTDRRSRKVPGTKA